MNGFAAAQQVADAVLYEGYALYPYRASDAKNRVRWQFGVLMPPAYVSADPSERSWSQTECLLEGAGARLTVRLRFLQVQNRVVEQATGSGGFRPVEMLDGGDTVHLPWDEAVERAVDVEPAGAGETCVPFEIEGGTDVGPLPGGRYVRRRRPLRGLVRCRADALPGPYGVTRLQVRVENHSGVDETADRSVALRGALVAHHVLVAADGGTFLSLLDPPEWAKGFASECRNAGVLPVLVGDTDRPTLVLSSPIYLYDFPSVAPESRTPFYDSTEIDEMLSLRTMTLTEQEKREARGTDPRTAELIADVDSLPADVLDRLHGTLRYVQAAAPETNSVAGLTKGSRVRLRPGRGSRRGSDAQDMFLEGRLATVEAVLLDVDGVHHVAVALDDETGDIQRAHGRFLYFAPGELDPVGGDE